MLACARVELGAKHRERIVRLARGPLDWPRFARALVWHRVVPVAQRCLEAACPDHLPPDVRADLAARARHSAQRNEVLAAELVVLMTALEAGGIAAVPLKGPLVATRAYGGLALRWSGDLDIAVPTSDYARGRRLLMERGYTEDATRGAFVRKDGHVTVDLQHRGWFSSPLDLALPWDRLGQASLLGTSIPTLDVEDMLIHLCAHGAKHCWDRLGWVCDVAELCRSHPHIAWSVVTNRARALRLERVLGLGLALARDLLDADIPETVGRFGPDGAGAALARDVRRSVLLGATGAVGAVGRPLFRLRTREYLRDKAAYAGYYLATWARTPATTFRSWRGERRRRMKQ